jgi:hypothetical protein
MARFDRFRMSAIRSLLGQTGHRDTAKMERMTQQRHSTSRDAVFGSEEIDRREARILSDAIPEVNCKTDIAGPKRKPFTAGKDLNPW